jgi:hypothetical protein
MIHQLLKRYVSKPVEFLTLIGKVGAMFSGSSALWLATGKPSEWTPNDLDIYVPRDKDEAIIDFLVEDGYQHYTDYFETPERPEVYEESTVSYISKLFKGGESVDIIESSDDTSVLPVSGFHSTATMNFITAESIVILYPSLTFSGISVISGVLAASKTTEWEEKYKSRLFEVTGVNGLSEKRKNFCLKYTYRKIGDENSLCFTFDGKGLSRPVYEADWVMRFRA